MFPSLFLYVKYSFILLFSQRYSETSKQRLDRAILTFFQNFRKAYVGDQAMHSSKVNEILLFVLLLSYHVLILFLSTFMLF